MALPRNDKRGNNENINDSNNDDFIIDETKNSNTNKVNDRNVFKRGTPKNTIIPENVQTNSPSTNTPVTKEKKAKKKKDEIQLEKNNNWIYWIIGVILLILLVGGILLLINVFSSNDGEIEQDYSKEAVITEDIGTMSGDNISENELYEDYENTSSENYNNLSEEEYRQLMPWNNLSITEALTSEKLIEADNYKIVSASIADLPSESAGYTSNLNDMFLEDGTYNPMFSYLTQENVSRELTIILEALTNPVFGGWLGVYQTGNPDGFDKAYFDFYDPIVLENLSIQELPIFVDWSGKAFGVIGGFIPQIKSISNDFTFEDSVTLNTVADITLIGETSEGAKVEKNIVINLTLIQNPDGADYPRLIVQSGTLTEI